MRNNSARHKTASFKMLVATTLASGAILLAIYFLMPGTKNRFERITRDQMKDPASVEFQNILVFYDSKSGMPSGLCGRINARNSYGGYTGFRNFVYMDVASKFVPAHTALIETDASDGEGISNELLNIHWHAFCDVFLKRMTPEERSSIQDSLLKR